MSPMLWQALPFGVAMAVSFFMSGFEAGVFALNRLRIRQHMREGSTSARLLHGYLENTENFLWTIFLGNTLANFVVIVLFVGNLRRQLGSHPLWFWLAFLAGGTVLYVASELLPKSLFRRFPNRLCLRLVRPFQFFHVLLSPLVAVAETFARLLLRWSGGAAYTGSVFANREEFRQLIRERSETLTGTEQQLINRVLDLQNATVASVARPLETAIAADAETPAAEILARCREHHVTRLPVWGGAGRMRRIVGIVNLRTLLYDPQLRPERRAREFLRPVLFLDEGTRLEEALRRLQRSEHHFAIVMGPDRKEAGLVTLWDILGAMFGPGVTVSRQRESGT